MIDGFRDLQILGSCLMDCYNASCKAGKPLGLKIFVSGRGRLENDGAKSLAAAFKVGPPFGFSFISFIQRNEVKKKTGKKII